MPQQGPNSAGPYTNDASFGTVTWTGTASNITTLDGQYVQAGLVGGTFNTKYLKVTGFGFTVPPGATITGVLAEVNWLAVYPDGVNSNQITDAAVKLVVGGVVSGSDRAGGFSAPLAAAYQSYGSTSDLWGLSLATSDVNGSSFGLVYAAFLNSPAGDTVILRLDHVRMTVSYTGGTLPTFAPPIADGPPLRGAPWFRLKPTLQPPPQIPAPSVQPYAIYPPPVVAGPPIPGAPWALRSLVTRNFHQTPETIPAPPARPVYGPEIVAGPPLPGAPWFRLAAGVHGPGAFPQVSQARPSSQRPFVTRPLWADRRQQRFGEQVTQILNSLIARGNVTLDGPGTYSLLSGALTAGRPPSADDDAAGGALVGCAWVDTESGNVYFCVDASIGAAVWVGIAASSGFSGNT